MERARAIMAAAIAVAVMVGSCTSASAQFRWARPLSPIPQADIYFAEGSATLTDDAKMALDAEARELLAHPKYKVIVYGHADPFEAGSTQGAWDLGLKRALAAMTYLIVRGVPADRLRPDSRGCDYLILTHDTPDARANMRMVTTEVRLPGPRSNKFCYGMCG